MVNIVKKNKKKITLLEVALVIYILLVFGFTLFGPEMRFGHRDGGEKARKKACYSNIRIIQGAIEMYNMDSNTMMKKLDIDLLVKEKYLKDKPVPPVSYCNYNGDDLINSGCVYCDAHGDLEGKYEDKSETMTGYPAHKDKSALNDYISACWSRFPFALLSPLLLIKEMFRVFSR